MKKGFVFFLVLFGVNFVAQTDPFSPKNGIVEKYVPTYVFKNAIIHVSSQETIDDGTLVIKGDKIVAIGQGVKFPENSLVFDLEGKHIYHSFIELNSHFGIKKTKQKKWSSTPQYKTSKVGPYHWNEAIHPEYKAEKNYIYNLLDFLS